MKSIALVGGSGGIGAAIITLLCERDDVSDVHATYFKSPAASSLGSIGQFGSNTQLHWSQLDITDERSVQQWLADIPSIDWLINCAGFLHDTQTRPEKSVSQLQTANFEKNMQINCLPNLLLAKHAGDTLKRSEQGIFASITAKVGSIEDNRLGGWYSYRASKAAANMVLKTLSIEWQRTAPNLRVVAMHPGTTATKLSAPFQSGVRPEKLFSTEKTAALLLAQLDQLHDHPSGRFVAYDGEELPW